MKQYKLIFYFVFLSVMYVGLAGNDDEQIQPKRPIRPRQNCQNALFPEFPCCGVSNVLLGKSESGVDLDVNEFPWIVVIIGIRTNAFCSGSLINSRWVLTTANCIFNILGAEWKLRVVFKSENPEDEVFPVIKTIFHESYDSLTEENSIALLLLNSPVTFDYVVKPICLPFNETIKMDAGEVGIVTSWAPELNLKIGLVRILDFESCMQLKPDFIPEMCATRDDQINKNYTLGGPLMIPVLIGEERYKVHYIVGATHFAYGNSSDVQTYAYVNVYKYLKWINDTVLRNQQMIN